MIKWAITTAAATATLVYLLPWLPGYVFSGNLLHAFCIAAIFSLIAHGGRKLTRELVGDLIGSNHRFPSFVLCTAATAIVTLAVPSLLVLFTAWLLPSIISISGILTAILSGLSLIGIVMLTSLVCPASARQEDTSLAGGKVQSLYTDTNSHPTAEPEEAIEDEEETVGDEPEEKTG